MLAKKKTMSVDDAPSQEYVIPEDIIFYDVEALYAKQRRAKEAMKRMWLDGDGPVADANSGGKDSTCKLKLLVEAILELPEEQRGRRKLYVVTSDTKGENPNIEAYLHDQKRMFNEWAMARGLNFEWIIVSRTSDKGFFYLTLGKGYPLPGNRKARWCTHRLKIDPQNEAYKRLQPDWVLVGARRSESAERDKKLDDYATDDIYVQGTYSSTGYRLMMPVIEFNVEDVWATLAEDLPWSSVESVKTLYQEATGECGFRNPKAATEPVKACGARFGCWFCPPIADDRSTEKMSETHRWMEPLTAWRAQLKQTYGEFKPSKVAGETRGERSAALRAWEGFNAQTRLANRSGYNRKGERLEDGQGTLRISARKVLLETLIETERNVNTIRTLEGLESLRLIEDDELALIHAQWIEDDEQRPWLR